MVLKVHIEDGRGTGQRACTTKRGELVVNKFDYSVAYAVKVEAVSTAYNFVPPIQGKRFVITDIMLYANKNVGANDASVQVYEAAGATDTAVLKDILDIEMKKNTSRDLIGLNLILSEGIWLNIKTDDDDIFSTVMGFYVDA